MTKIYLFRHGETDWNKIGKVQFSIDTELNETGIEQAKRNAESLKGSGIQHIYSSPLKRAYKTGKILADTLGIDIEIVDGLEENKSDIEYCRGLTKIEIVERFGKKKYEDYFNTKDGSLNEAIFGAETKLEMRNRIVKTVNDICKTTLYNIIGIASHGMVLQEFLRYYDFKPDNKLVNTETIEAEYNNGKINIIRRIKKD